MLPPVETRLAVHVVIHRGELEKPSSTGNLVVRTVLGATSHVYQRATRFHAASPPPVVDVGPSLELWILHPGGDPFPACPAGGDAILGCRQPVLLLDGTWRQAGEMLRGLGGLGRCFRLPDADAAPSRYWLRDQPTSTQLSTAEALMGVFRSGGERDAERRLQLHFELHVYATLLSRGRREMAERYLGHSPLLAERPEVLHRLHTR